MVPLIRLRSDCGHTRRALCESSIGSHRSADLQFVLCDIGPTKRAPNHRAQRCKALCLFDSNTSQERWFHTLPLRQKISTTGSVAIPKLPPGPFKQNAVRSANSPPTSAGFVRLSTRNVPDRLSRVAPMLSFLEQARRSSIHEP